MSSSHNVRLAFLCAIGLLAQTTNLPAAPEPGEDKKLTNQPTDLPLPEGPHARLGSGRFSHPGIVVWMAALPGGKRLLTLAGDGRIRQWEAATGRELLQLPVLAVPWAAGNPENELAQLIEELDAEDFETREKASEKLVAGGKSAEEAARKALANKPSAEAKVRLEQILKKATENGPNNPELVLAVHVVEVLERIGTPEARKVVEDAAKGPKTAPLPAEAQSALERRKARKP